jgi:hypothetical protein
VASPRRLQFVVPAIVLVFAAGVIVVFAVRLALGV